MHIEFIVVLSFYQPHVPTKLFFFLLLYIPATVSIPCADKAFINCQSLGFDKPTIQKRPRFTPTYTNTTQKKDINLKLDIYILLKKRKEKKHRGQFNWLSSKRKETKTKKFCCSNFRFEIFKFFVLTH